MAVNENADQSSFAAVGFIGNDWQVIDKFYDMAANLGTERAADYPVHRVAITNGRADCHFARHENQRRGRNREKDETD
jgi:hypothetical protein